MRRVVVTGMGMVTPLGSGVDHNWSQIIAGKSGIARIEHFDVSDISCQIAGQVPGPETDGGLNLDDWIDPRDQRKPRPTPSEGCSTRSSGSNSPRRLN